MPIFNLDDLNPATRFYFNEDNTSEGFLEVRICNGAELEKINKATTKKKVDFRKRQRFEFLEVNEDKHAEMLTDYAIVNWDGVNDPSGNAIPCTLENKMKLMSGSTLFANFYAKCAEDLNNDKQNDPEEQEKN